MFSLGVCNFSNKFCGCQTYKEDDNNPEKCYYCNHYNAFHTGFSPPPQNNSPPLLGACQKDGVSCGCQAYSANPNNELKCKFCDHFTAFHKNTSVSTLTGDFRVREKTIKNGSLLIINKKKRNRQNLRNHNSPNTVVSKGRPANVSLKLNHILLFKQGSWENNSAPRENTTAWIEMSYSGLIVDNVCFNENTAEAINALITRSFSDVNELNWILLKAGSGSRLKAATCQEKSLKNFRANMSKSNKRLYLAIKSNTSCEADAK